MELLVACGWCERIKLDGWVEPEVAIRRLRTFEWPSPPRFSHGICEACVTERMAERGAVVAQHEALRPIAAVAH